MTYDELKLMTDEEIYELSLQKNRRGCYTKEANMAYEERKRRSGHVNMFAGIPKRCGKYQADIDYYGYPN